MNIVIDETTPRLVDAGILGADVGCAGRGFEVGNSSRMVRFAETLRISGQDS